MIELVKNVKKMEDEHLAKTINDSSLWFEDSEGEVEHEKKLGKDKKR